MGSIPKTYTNMGTVSIDPPPPMSPKTRPINTAPRYPSISIVKFTNSVDYTMNLINDLIEENL